MTNLQVKTTGGYNTIDQTGRRPDLGAYNVFEQLSKMEFFSKLDCLIRLQLNNFAPMAETGRHL